MVQHINKSVAGGTVLDIPQYLKVPEGGFIQIHKLSGIVFVQGCYMGKQRLGCKMDIIQNYTGRKQLRVGLLEPQPLEAYYIELPFYSLYRGCHVKLPVGEPVYDYFLV